MNLDFNQRQLLASVTITKQRRDDNRRATEIAIRAAVDDRAASFDADFERAVFDAHLAGVPKARIAREIGTSNPTPVRAIIKKVEASRRASISERYALGSASDLLLVHLDGDELAQACEATGWTVSEAKSAVVDRATFRVISSSLLIAETSSFVVEVGRLHPVVSFVRDRGSAEALAWWKGMR